MSYLANLTLRLATGAMRLPDPQRRRHAAFLTAAQNSDGGFSGRQGPSDPYYTSFALRSLVLLGSLEQSTARSAAGFLRKRLRQPSGVMDFVALVQSALSLEWTTGTEVFADADGNYQELVPIFFRSLRRADGGYAKSVQSSQSSTYATFLAASCLQLLGLPFEDAAAMAALVRSRRRDDGGFVELAALKQSGTNPTAAAVGTLRLLNDLDSETVQTAAAFLVGMQNAEGGLRANTKIPLADLLSTCSGLVALADLEGLGSINAAAVRSYLGSLEAPEGGFRGGIWDDMTDVEYTFYGLAALALLTGGGG